MSNSKTKTKQATVEHESPKCPFCEFPLVTTESLEVGICAECQEMIHAEQEVAWESHGERLCQGPDCYELLQIGENKYCSRCRGRADLLLG